MVRTGGKMTLNETLNALIEPICDEMGYDLVRLQKDFGDAVSVGVIYRLRRCGREGAAD